MEREHIVVATPQQNKARFIDLGRPDRASVSQGEFYQPLKGGDVQRTDVNTGGSLLSGGGPPQFPVTTEGYKQPPAASTHRKSQLALFELGAPQW